MPWLALVLVALAAASARAEPMKPDMPMKGEMKKEGMKRGDVGKAARQKKKRMDEMMEAERAGKKPAR